LLAEVAPIFTLVAHWGVAKFSSNETKRGDNSYEDREHGAMLNGRELGLPELNWAIGINTGVWKKSCACYIDRSYAARWHEA
jgi:hypothetical protein